MNDLEKLNFLIAEHVFNYYTYKEEEIQDLGYRKIFGSPNMRGKYLVENRILPASKAYLRNSSVDFVCPRIPSYSSNLDLANKVLDRFKESFSIHITCDAGIWAVCLYKTGEDHKVFDDNLSKAICKIALKIKGFILEEEL